MYKKVYLEITNVCNLNCPFCLHNKRPRQFMNFETFQKILDQLKPYTKYLYFHVLGEPLMHPNINEFINYASSSFFINITTNGYLIAKIKDNPHIRQLNISLHSFDDRNGVSFNEYMDNIWDVIDHLKNTYVSLRLWRFSEYTNQILQAINAHYGLNLRIADLKGNMTLAPHVYLSLHAEFDWPTLEDDQVNCSGTCLALKNHIGILVDGTVVPCCLDGNGYINLGHLPTDNLADIIQSDRYQKMYHGFQNNKLVEPLCQRCHFRKE